MNPSLERSALLGGVIILFASLQFGACLGGSASALVAALFLGAGATWLWSQFSLPMGSRWIPPVVLGLVAAIVSALVDLTVRPGLGEWFTLVPAGIGSAVTASILHRSKARCGLCNRRLMASSLVLACPRCAMHVCEETCWSFEHQRCQLCLDQRVPLLPSDESWWQRVTGPRTRFDRCQVCRGAADKVDLRPCPHCRRAQCRDCWDFTNGQCQRCGTALPDLPASLEHTVISGLATR